MLHLITVCLTTYLSLTMILALLGNLSRRARFFARIMSCYFLLMTCAAYGVLASVVLRLIGKVSIAQWATARAFKTVTCPVVGIKFNVEGEERLDIRPAVFVANHQSELDLVFLGRVFPKHCSVTAKGSLKYIPFLGWFMALSGAIFIDRGDRESAIAAFDSAAEEMKTKQQSVFIFPEGTRSYFSEPDLLSFKKGAFHLAIRAQVPVIPVVVGNYAHILHLPSLRFERGLIDVRVLEPIPTEGLTAKDAPELTERVREVMLREIKSLGGGFRSLKSVKEE